MVELEQIFGLLKQTTKITNVYVEDNSTGRPYSMNTFVQGMNIVEKELWNLLYKMLKLNVTIQTHTFYDGSTTNEVILISSTNEPIYTICSNFQHMFLDADNNPKLLEVIFNVLVLDKQEEFYLLKGYGLQKTPIDYFHKF